MRKKAWRTRKDDRKLGRELTEAKLLRCGKPSAVWISAAFYGSAMAAARSRVGVGGLNEAKAAIGSPLGVRVTPPWRIRAAGAHVGVESGLDTRWKTRLTSGSHLAVT